MKKFLLPMLLLIAASGFVKAQLNETFETGTTPLAWTAADGTYLGVVNNPKPNSVNPSAKSAGYVKSNQHEYSLLIATMPTALNLTTNNRVTVQVYANRDKETKFIFKLEGSKGSKEFTKKIAVTKAWQEYTFDFSSLAANDSIKKIIFFFDPGVKDTKDTFYFDNIRQLPADACAGTVAPTTMNLLDDFECQRNASYGAGWDSLTVVDNPSRTGINISAKVGKYNDLAGNGTEYAALIHANVDPFDFAVYPYLRIKVLAPKAGLMLLKVEGGATSKEVGTQITAAQVGKWVEIGADFSSVKFGGNTKLVLFFNAGANGVAGDVYYIDDIRFTEIPALEDFEITPKLAWAPLNNDAALHGTFGGAVANPAPTSTVNNSPTVGKYTKGTAVISTLTATLTGFALATDAPQLNMMVYAPDAGKSVRLQLVSATKGNIEATATVTAANTWEDLKFDFTAAVGVTDISQMRVLFDPSAAASGKMYFFDNLKAGKLTINPCLTTVVDTNKLDDFECQRNATYAGTPPLTAIANPKQGTANPSDKVGQYNDPKDEWSALTIDYGTKSINFSRFNQLSVKIWSPTVVPLLFKLEGGTSPAVEKSATVSSAGNWVTYKIDFIDQKGKNHKKISIFFNAGVAHTTDDIYYLDDIEWQSEPISGCASDIESPIVFTYFANSDFGDKPVEIVNNPKKTGINTSAKVLKFDRRPGAEVYAGAFTDFGAPLKWLNNRYVIRAKVLMDHIGTFTAKLEPGNGGTGAVHEISVANTKINEWEEITVDFTGKVTGTEQYKRLTFFFDLNAPSPTVSQVSYVDEFVIGNGAGCGTSGIFDAVQVEKLSVFPNPALNELTVKNTEKIKRFEITNMLGQRVKTVILSNAFDNQTISLEGLDKGLYILSGYDAKGLIAISRFVKE